MAGRYENTSGHLDKQSLHHLLTELGFPERNLDAFIHSLLERFDYFCDFSAFYAWWCETEIVVDALEEATGSNDLAQITAALDCARSLTPPITFHETYTEAISKAALLRNQSHHVKELQPSSDDWPDHMQFEDLQTDDSESIPFSELESIILINRGRSRSRSRSETWTDGQWAYDGVLARIRDSDAAKREATVLERRDMQLCIPKWRLGQILIGTDTERDEREQKRRMTLLPEREGQREYALLAETHTQIETILEEWEQHVTMTYERGKRMFLGKVVHCADSVLEIFNEGGDVVFTFITLASLGGALYYTNICIIILNVLLRLAVAMRNWPRVDTGIVTRNDNTTNFSRVDVKDGNDQRPLFLLGLLIFLVEPQTGGSMMDSTLRSKETAKINGNLNPESDEFTRDISEQAIAAKNAFARTRTRLNTAAALLVAEDVPELTIELIFALTQDRGALDLFFWFSIAGTVLHMIRHGLEFRYDLCNISRLRQKALNTDKTFDPSSATREELRKWLNDHGEFCRALVLEQCYFVNDFDLIDIAASCRDLLSLDVSGCRRITDEGLQELAGYCKDLRFLNVNDCPTITDKSLHVLSSGCRDLHWLDLGGCRAVTSTGLEAISKHCRDLRTLHLSGCNEVCDQGLEAIALRCQALRTLNLSGCNEISDIGLGILARRCSALSALSLNGCNLVTDEGLWSIATSSRRLVSLDLSGCMLVTDCGLGALATHCPELSTLYLCGCHGITDDGLEAVATHCRALETLDLSGCSGITDRGVRLVAACGYPELRKDTRRLSH